MNQEEFTGTVGDMSNSPWLASTDIEGFGDVSVEIEGVKRTENAKMDGGKIEPEIFSLAFKGKSKQLVLNATNRKTLAKMFGAAAKDWKGKTIKLYVEHGIRNPRGGDKVSGIRIKFESKGLGE